MPQQVHVVRCYNCEVFQVDIVKKVPKWTCKMCGEKQSLKKVYSMGSGRDCREFVQDLNKQKLTMQISSISEKLPDISQAESKEPLDTSMCVNESKWSEYIWKNEDTTAEDLHNSNIASLSNVYLNEEIMKDRNKSNTLNKNVFSTSCVSGRLYSNYPSKTEAEMNLCDSRQYDNKYEENTLIGSNTEVCKRPAFSGYIENKSTKRKKSDEHCNLYSEFLEVHDNLEEAQISVPTMFSSCYDNKFGDSSNLDVDLQF